MVNTLIDSEVKSLAGADLYANCVADGSFLDQPAIEQFLAKSSKSVDDYAFVSASTNRIMKAARGGQH